MKTNMGCELPCWWGITPGKTTWAEMVDTFARHGIRFSEAGKLDLGAHDQKSYEDLLDVTFQKEEGLVSGIDVNLADFDLLAQSGYRDLWQKYALDKILSRDGIPTQVQLELTVGAPCWSPGMRTYYDLWLTYQDRGLSIRYPGELIRDNQGWYVCPAAGQFQGLEIRLRSPKDSKSAVILAGEEDAPFRFGGTLQDLTHFSPQQFYEVFKQIPRAQCLLVNDPDAGRYDKFTLPKPSMILPVAQEEEYLINNLAGNAGCELPCWWGIKPGETSTEYVQQMFLNLGKSVSRNEDSRGLQYRASLFGRHSPYPFDYTVEHRWFDKNGIVDLFGVTGSALNWSPPQHFAQEWNRYALHAALARYGVPSKVLVHYWNFGWRYDITLVYEDKGFLIRYSGSIIDEGKESSKKPVVICPTQNKPSEITIWMTQPASKALANFEYGRWYLSPSNSPMPALEKVTKMSVPDFYNTFLNPDTTTCLTVPRDKGEMAP